MQRFKGGQLWANQLADEELDALTSDLKGCGVKREVGVQPRGEEQYLHQLVGGRRFRDDGEQGGSGDDKDKGKSSYGYSVFVSGLPLEVTKGQIVEHFGTAGTVKIDQRSEQAKVWMHRDKITGKSNGLCTVTYDDLDAAKTAITKFHQKEFQGHTLNVTIANRSSTSFGGGDFARRGRGGFNRGGVDRTLQRGGGWGAAVGIGRGDWTCGDADCGNSNFYWRYECHRCGSPRLGANQSNVRAVGTGAAGDLERMDIDLEDMLTDEGFAIRRDTGRGRGLGYNWSGRGSGAGIRREDRPRPY